MMARLLALLLLALFLGRTFYKGWTTDESDFPNYYTAAVLLRKHEALRKYYDWTWFQRQMNFAGFEHQLGAYVPQTPLTMVPLVPLAGFPPQTAKRIWLTLNLGFLAAVVWLLSRVTGFRVEHLALLTFLGYGSLQSNFHLGQYYVFLLFLLTVAFFCLDRKKAAVSGFLFGAAFGLKLYGGPLLLYFAVKRNWNAVAGFVAAAACALAAAVAFFGWGDVHFYATQILPRSLEGEVIDPYSSHIATLSTLLRRLFVMEPDLNPQPLWNAPLLFFFLRPFVTLLIVAFTLAGLASKHAGLERRDFAWFMIAVLLLAANTASYTFILLLLPVALLLRDAGMAERIFLVVSFVALNFPLRAGWTWVFPKLWVLLALFLVAGREYLRPLRPKLVACAVIVVAALASVDARRHAMSYAAEPGRRYERIASDKPEIFRSSPAVSRAGLFYQSIGTDRYVLRWLHNGQTEELVFEGQAFHPIAPSPDGPVYFELVAHGASTTMAFDPSTRGVTLTSLADSAGAANSFASPDGKWVAFESTGGGPRQIWLRSAASGTAEVLTGGNCNNTSPAWELDSKAIVFASDCDRGMGLPALYRARTGSR